MSEFFRRVEKKYIIDKNQYELIKKGIENEMDLDPHGKSTICNLYLDDDKYSLIKNSLQKPVYKDKLRIRSYNVSNLDSDVYVEVKKKYEGVVSKRRIKAKLADVYAYLNKEKEIPSANLQVGKELDYYFKFYNLHPTAYITYDREAYYAKNDNGFRITFDTNIQARDYDLLLDKGIYGTRIFDEDKVLMEVKTLGGIPMWFVKMMSEYKIRQGNFSKYGATYLQIIKEKEELKRKNIVYEKSNQILNSINNRKSIKFNKPIMRMA